MSLYSNKLGAVGYCYDTPGPYLGFYKCVCVCGRGGGGGGAETNISEWKTKSPNIFPDIYT